MRRSVFRLDSVSSTDGLAVLSRASQFFSALKDQLSSPASPRRCDLSHISASLRALYCASGTANTEPPVIPTLGSSGSSGTLGTLGNLGDLGISGPSGSSGSSGTLGLSGPLGPSAVGGAEWAGGVVRAAAAGGWLSAALDAEGRAALLAALLPRPQWNNSATRVAPAESLDALERSAADAVAALLRLPPRFAWHGAEEGAEASGGGVVHSTALESLLVAIATARAQALARYVSARFSGPDDVARVSQRLVLYVSDQAHPLIRRAARCMGIQHVSVLQTVYSPVDRNYPISLDMLHNKLAEDVAQGLYPLLVTGVFGGCCSGAVDPLAEMAELCHRMGVWMHIDAGHAGLALATQSAEKGSTVSNSPNTDRSVGVDGATDMNAKARVDTTINGGSEAHHAIWQRHQHSFYRAAALVDSIHFGPSSFLPLHAGITSTSSLLFVADTAKVRAALQRMHDEGETATTAWLTPAATTLSRLRLESPELRFGGVVRHALGLAQHDAASVGRTVLDHQNALHYIERRVRADGRFDCTVLSGFFGFVLFRWLTLADEETEELMRRLTELVSTALEDNSMALPRVSLGLTRIHRRVFVCLSIAANKEEPERTGESCVPQCELDNLLKLLRQAALTHNSSLLHME